MFADFLDLLGADSTILANWDITVIGMPVFLAFMFYVIVMLFNFIRSFFK